jgi:hypothetical protein
MFEYLPVLRYRNQSMRAGRFGKSHPRTRSAVLPSATMATSNSSGMCSWRVQLRALAVAPPNFQNTASMFSGGKYPSDMGVYGGVGNTNGNALIHHTTIEFECDHAHASFLFCESLTGCVPGDWRGQCSQSGYGDVLSIYIYIYNPMTQEGP